MPYNQTSAIRGALRRTFSRSPVVREVLMSVRREVPRYNKDGSRAKKDSVQYLCALCGTWEKSTKVSVDHITPVIAEEGFIDWNEFIARLFCEKEQLQPVCDTCHQKKTNAERLERSRIKDLKALDSISEILHADGTRAALKFARKYTKKTKHPEVVAVATGWVQRLKLR